MTLAKITPEDALLAAAVLDMHRPDSSAVQFLRDYARSVADPRPCVWRVSAGDLLASEPGARVRRFANVPAFALVAPVAWGRVGHWVRIGYSKRAEANAQRYRLAGRLEQLRCHTLAQAVRDIRFRTIDGEVFMCYDPDEFPIVVRE